MIGGVRVRHWDPFLAVGMLKRLLCCQKLGRSYRLQTGRLSGRTSPIKRPDNGLPLRLVQRSGGAAAAAVTAAPELVLTGF